MNLTPCPQNPKNEKEKGYEHAYMWLTPPPISRHAVPLYYNIFFS